MPLVDTEATRPIGHPFPLQLLPKPVNPCDLFCLLLHYPLLRRQLIKELLINQVGRYRLLITCFLRTQGVRHNLLSLGHYKRRTLMSCQIDMRSWTCFQKRCQIYLVSVLQRYWYWSKSLMSCQRMSLLYFRAVQRSQAWDFRLVIYLSIIQWVIVTRNIYFFCYSISTIV